MITAGTDPIEQYLQANVPVRVLLQHGASGLDWLTALETNPIILSYRNAAGDFVAEQVNKIGLIERSHALGWVPWASGEGEGFSFHDVYMWEDDASEAGAIPGVWFVHDDAACWDDFLQGIPFAIPQERFATLKLRGEIEANKARDEMKQRAEEAVLHTDALYADGLIRDRIRGRFEFDGTRLTRTKAWQEIEEVAAEHGMDPWGDKDGDFMPPLPWSEEVKQQMRRVCRFIADAVSGRPLEPGRPLGPISDDSNAPTAATGDANER